MRTGIIDPRYGDASATAPAWTEIDRLLTDAQLYWIITVRADGRPHAVPLVGVWYEGAFAFCTGVEEQKYRNLESNAQVVVTTGSTGAGGWNQGQDVGIEGAAVRVTDPVELQVLADAWFDKYGDDWNWAVVDQEFGPADGDGSHRARVYRVDADKVLVFGGPHGQTRYRR